MHSLFTKPLDILKKWPSMGSTASHRLFNAFLTQKSTLQNLKKLVDFFEHYQICEKCFSPMAENACENCLALESADKILVVAHAVDYLLLSQTFWPLNCAFLVLEGYISPIQQQSLDTTGLIRSLKMLEKRSEKSGQNYSLYTLFNQSLEARGTLWLMRSLASSCKIYDLSSFLGSKEALFALHPKELNAYKMQIQNSFPS